METYSVVPAEGGWGISQNKTKPEGSYATREGAFEAVYLAASNDIKKGHGVTSLSSLRELTSPPPAERRDNS
jgi:hypothetical protein